MSFGGSLVLAVGLAFLFEHLDNRIKTPQELKAHLGVPFLGMVPAVGEEPNGAANPLLNNGAARELRRSVQDDPDQRAVLVGRGRHAVARRHQRRPGEGKSIVAANLAIALAQAGQRVLLIDADMRRPRVHEIFEIAQEPGLSTC